VKILKDEFVSIPLASDFVRFLLFDRNALCDANKGAQVGVKRIQHLTTVWQEEALAEIGNRTVSILSKDYNLLIVEIWL
jgi:hypothetical protein